MIKIYNDDCLNVMKEMEEESVDLIVTDCPYKISQGGCSNNSVTFKAMSGVLNKQRNYECIDKEYVKSGKMFKYNDIKFSDWLPELYRILKKDSHCYIMINARNLKDLWDEAENVGFKFLNLIVWDKGNSLPNRWYMNSVEYIILLRKGKAKTINNKGEKNILRIPNIIGNKQHPTEKPIELMKILIENSSNENDTVIDPFMGAGSTGIACKELNRNFIGIELDKQYFDIAKKRIEAD